MSLVGKYDVHRYYCEDERDGRKGRGDELRMKSVKANARKWDAKSEDVNGKYDLPSEQQACHLNNGGS